MTTDTQLIPTPAPPPPGAEAWFNLALSVGDLTKQIKADREQRARPQVLRYSVSGAQVVSAAGAATIDLGAPAAGRAWSVRRLMILDTANPGGLTGGGTATAASTTYAAGAAGTVALPAGAALAGFDITTLPVATAASGTVTVAGLAAGTLSYELAEAVGGSTLSIRYPAPLPPASSASTPQVQVPAITSGAAYALTVYGTTAVTGATPGAGWWYVGSPSVFGPQSAVWQIPSLPTTLKAGSDQITLQPGEHLAAAVTGATTGRTLIARADVLDYPLSAGLLVEAI